MSVQASVDLRLGDCLQVLRDLDDCSVDAVVTDPPYGISFMGKHWDRFDIEERVGKRDVSKLGVRLTGGIETPNRKQTARTASAYANAAGAAGGYDFTAKGNRAFQAWCEQWGAECLRVLKPGGHLLSFGGTRTYHRLASGLEDAGFEIRDCLAWMFGSGFPKSLDVSKAIDKGAGHWRGRAGEVVSENGSMGGPNYERTERGDPVTAAAAAAWDGWGTALKPAFEPIVLARKPLSGTVAATVLEHGTGALNVDGCRIGLNDDERTTVDSRSGGSGGGRDGFLGDIDREPGERFTSHKAGRWPANVLLDDEAAAMLDEQTGDRRSAYPGRPDLAAEKVGRPTRENGVTSIPGNTTGLSFADSGGASRFFYCAKVSRAERNAGLDGFEDAGMSDDGYGSIQTPKLDRSAPRENWQPRPVKNVHPTVKPIDLMRWLIRLVTPPGGLVLDPFLGSGTTGIAAALEGFRFVGVEREPDYMRIAEARLAFWREHGEDGLRIVALHDAADTARETRREAGQLSLLAEPA